MALDKFIEKNGINFDRSHLRYRLMKMQKHPRYIEEMSTLLSMNRLKDFELKKIHQIWIDNPKDQQSIDDEGLYTFAWNMANKNQFETSEKVFELLFEKPNRHPSLANLARKYSVFYVKVKDFPKRNQ